MRLLSAFILSLLSFAAPAQVVINELMQSNIDCVLDDLNDFPDSWVELHNTGSATVDIEGFRISVNSDFATAYALPSAVIDPDGYLLVYCDKVGAGLHADFRIDSGKGDLYLFDADGNTIDSVVKMAKQPAPNIAYGRSGDGWGYQLTPTPGVPNDGGTASRLMPAPLFSIPGGVYAEGDTLALAMRLPGGVPDYGSIIYTTDGCEPYPGTAIVYDGADIVIDSCTVIRAKIVADGCLSAPSTVQSYIFLDREQQVPVISLAIDPDYLYDDTLGILAEGVAGPDSANYLNNWRRPLNLELYWPGTPEATLNQLCETRVHGQTSRLYPMKSMVVYANKRFGEKRFKARLWPDDKPDVAEPKSLILRNGGGAFSRGYVYDALAQRVIGRNSATLDWQGYQPAVVYINGEYHGVLNMRERSDEDNIAANYGGLEDIVIVDYRDAEIAIEQGREDTLPLLYRDLLDFVRQKHTYDQWAEVIDLESYADLLIMHVWGCDSDFPGNNQVLWRRTGSGDQRWRWLIKDMDQSFGLYGKWSYYTDYHTDWLLAGNPNRTCYAMLYNLLDCPEFVELYTARFVAHTGTFLNSTTIRQYLDEIIELNHDELAISHAKWNQIYHDMGKINLRDLDYDFDQIRTWVDGRQRHIHQLQGDALGLGTPVSVRVVSDGDAPVAISYDGIPLGTCAPTPDGMPLRLFDGFDYVGRTVRLSTDTDIYGWWVQIGDAPTYCVTGNVLEIPIATTDKVRITLLTDHAGLADVTADPSPLRYDPATATVTAPGQTITLTDLAGRVVATAPTASPSRPPACTSPPPPSPPSKSADNPSGATL